MFPTPITASITAAAPTASAAAAATAAQVPAYPLRPASAGLRSDISLGLLAQLSSCSNAEAAHRARAARAAAAAGDGAAVAYHIQAWLLQARAATERSDSAADSASVASASAAARLGLDDDALFGLSPEAAADAVEEERAQWIRAGGAGRLREATYARRPHEPLQLDMVAQAAGAMLGRPVGHLWELPTVTVPVAPARDSETGAVAGALVLIFTDNTRFTGFGEQVAAAVASATQVNHTNASASPESAVADASVGARSPGTTNSASTGAAESTAELSNLFASLSVVGVPDARVDYVCVHVDRDAACITKCHVLPEGDIARAQMWKFGPTSRSEFEKTSNNHSRLE